MSIDHSVNSTVRDRGIVQRDVDQIKHVSDARLRSLEIMATIVPTRRRAGNTRSTVLDC